MTPSFCHMARNYHEHHRRKCGRDLEMWTGFMCERNNFKFPFTIPRSVHRSRFTQLKRSQSDKMDPYKFTATFCCKKGCSTQQYLDICKYDKIIRECKATHRNIHYRKCIKSAMI